MIYGQLQALKNSLQLFTDLTKQLFVNFSKSCYLRSVNCYWVTIDHQYFDPILEKIFCMLFPWPTWRSHCCTKSSNLQTLSNTQGYSHSMNMSIGCTQNLLLKWVTITHEYYSIEYELNNWVRVWVIFFSYVWKKLDFGQKLPNFDHFQLSYGKFFLS